MKIGYSLLPLCVLLISSIYPGELDDLCSQVVRIELENKLQANVAQHPDGSIVQCDYCKEPATVFVMACTEISKFCAQHSHLSKKK